MGLDSYLFKRGKSSQAKIMREIAGDKDKEIAYWRKEWDIHEIFANFRDAGTDDNVTEIPVTKEQFESIVRLEYLSEETKALLLKILNETDWENEEIYYFAWY